MSQLKRLDEFISSREAIASVYTRRLRSVNGLAPLLPFGRSSWYKYVVCLNEGIDRDSFRTRMKERRVSLSGGVYDTPLHRQPVAELFEVGSDYSGAEQFCSRHVCLPIFVGMTEEAAEYVIDAAIQSI